MTAPNGPVGPPIRREIPQPEQAQQPPIRRRQPRGLAGINAAAQPDIETAPAPAAPEAPVDPVALGDDVFSGVRPGPVAPNTQPPTEESRRAVMEEAKARAESVDKASRDFAVANRLFSGENAHRSPRDRARQLSKRNDVYAQYMAMNCLKPLAQGVDASSLMGALSTAAVMWALSPQFRQVTAEYNAKINEALRVRRAEQMETNRKVPLGSSKETVDAAEMKAQREDRALLDQVSAVLAGQDSVPFSTETAARSLIQLHEDAYVAMREGADASTVMRDLGETVDELHSIWREQKLDPQVVTATARTMLGREAGGNDVALSQFVQTAYGDVRMGPQQVVRGRGGVASVAWNDRWMLAGGGVMNAAKSGMFNVRPPMDAATHQGELGRLILADLSQAASAGPDELHRAMIGHMSAWDLRDVKLGPTTVGGASSDRGIACAQRARIALAAMVDDGIQPELRQQASSNALEWALTEFETKNPEATAELTKKFGEDFSAARSEFVAKGLERGKHDPLRPMVSGPANPVHQAQMRELGIAAPEPEPARDLGVFPPQINDDGTWRPRAHDAGQRVEVEESGPKIERKQVSQTDVERKPVVTRERKPEAPGPAAEQMPVWRLVSDKENLSRKAKGYETVSRVPGGMKPVPENWAAYEKEIAERGRLEAVEARLSGRPAPVPPEPARDRRNDVQEIRLSPEATARRKAQREAAARAASTPSGSPTREIPRPSGPPEFDPSAPRDDVQFINVADIRKHAEQLRAQAAGNGAGAGAGAPAQPHQKVTPVSPTPTRPEKASPPQQRPVRAPQGWAPPPPPRKERSNGPELGG